MYIIESIVGVSYFLPSTFMNKFGGTHTLVMEWYKKCVDQEVANAKPFPFHDSCVLVHPQLNRPQTGSEPRETNTWTFPPNNITIKVPQSTKIWDKRFSNLFPIFKLTSEVAIVKYHYSISVRFSRYQDTRPTDLFVLNIY